MNTKKLERAYQDVTDVTWGYVLNEMESMNARIVFVGVDHLGSLFLSPEEIDEESGWTVYGLINLDEVDPDKCAQEFEKLKSNMLKDIKLMLDRARENDAREAKKLKLHIVKDGSTNWEWQIVGFARGNEVSKDDYDLYCLFLQDLRGDGFELYEEFEHKPIEELTGWAYDEQDEYFARIVDGKILYWTDDPDYVPSRYR